jgi:hypothetical protein
MDPSIEVHGTMAGNERIKKTDRFGKGLGNDFSRDWAWVQYIFEETRIRKGGRGERICALWSVIVNSALHVLLNLVGSAKKIILFKKWRMRVKPLHR